MTAATPSSAAQRPAGSAPGTKPRVVRPGALAFGSAAYSASEEKPCGVIWTSGCDEPPQPRNCGTSHVWPAGGVSHNPRSIVWALVPTDGRSKQSLVRTWVAPGGTSKPTIT